MWNDVLSEKCFLQCCNLRDWLEEFWSYKTILHLCVLIFSFRRYSVLKPMLKRITFFLYLSSTRNNLSKKAGRGGKKFPEKIRSFDTVTSHRFINCWVELYFPRKLQNIHIVGQNVRHWFLHFIHFPMTPFS